jgi:hypothetical protein
MRSGLAFCLICLLGLALAAAPRPASAMQFEQVPVGTDRQIIGARGPIIKDDTTRLELALGAVPQGRRLLGLAIDSPGGNVVEGEKLARLIRARNLGVIIPTNSKCASACFLMLAASPHRLAAADALVGVHSASENGKETDTSLAITTLMARDAAELGIPPAIIGKMVQTTPGRVEWLTREDLTSMQVTVYDGDPPLAALQPSVIVGGVPAPGAAPAPAVPVVVRPEAAAPPPIALGFVVGRNDRRVWDIWFGGLRGPYRDGAAFAQSQLGAAQPGSCYGPNGVNRGDFTLGCEIGRQRLALVQARMRASADYAAGWRSADAPVPVAATGGPADAEYEGAYFCGRQVAHLTLRVLRQADGERRRAMFIFGPQPTSPTVPRGAFIVEGAIDLHGGAMEFAPVSWVSQPADYPWLGLTGRSDDGGRTFAGRVTGNGACTIFTLRRVGNTAAAR